MVGFRVPCRAIGPQCAQLGLGLAASGQLGAAERLKHRRNASARPVRAECHGASCFACVVGPFLLQCFAHCLVYFVPSASTVVSPWHTCESSQVHLPTLRGLTPEQLMAMLNEVRSVLGGGNGY